MAQTRDHLALVSMTNKDVYYLTRGAAKTLMALIGTDDAPAFFETVDARSQSRIAIATRNVSSVVIPDSTGGRDV